MTRFISTLIAVLMTIAASSQQVKTPDFAYPKTVSKNADARLAAALKAGNDVAALRALTDWYLAQAMTAPENITPALNRIDSVCGWLASAPARAVGSLLKADIYYNLYMSESWKYDRRDTPLTPLPALMLLHFL